MCSIPLLFSSHPWRGWRVTTIIYRSLLITRVNALRTWFGVSKVATFSELGSGAPQPWPHGGLLGLTRGSWGLHCRAMHGRGPHAKQRPQGPAPPCIACNALALLAMHGPSPPLGVSLNGFRVLLKGFVSRGLRGLSPQGGQAHSKGPPLGDHLNEPARRSGPLGGASRALHGNATPTLDGRRPFAPFGRLGSPRGGP